MRAKDASDEFCNDKLARMISFSVQYGIVGNKLNNYNNLIKSFTIKNKILKSCCNLMKSNKAI